MWTFHAYWTTVSVSTQNDTWILKIIAKCSESQKPKLRLWQQRFNDTICFLWQYWLLISPDHWRCPQVHQLQPALAHRLLAVSLEAALPAEVCSEWAAVVQVHWECDVSCVLDELLFDIFSTRVSGLLDLAGVCGTWRLFLTLHDCSVKDAHTHYWKAIVR